MERPRKLRHLRADLRRGRWRVVRQTGSHHIWAHPLVPDLTPNIAGADGKDAKPYQEREVRDALQRSRAAEEAERRRKQQQQP
jgi:hypothetical protein